jgi:putative flippase GtrA
MRLIADFLSRRYLLFLFSGCTASALNIVLRLGFGQFMAYIPSIALAYVFSTLAAYLLNRYLVFKSTSTRYHVEATQFYMVNVVGLAQTILLSSLLSHLLATRVGLALQLSQTLAHVAALSTLAVTSFLLHKYWTFAPRRGD